MNSSVPAGHKGWPPDPARRLERCQKILGPLLASASGVLVVVVEIVPAPVVAVVPVPVVVVVLAVVVVPVVVVVPG